MLYHYQIENVPEWGFIFEILYVKHRKYVLFVFCFIVWYSDWLGIVACMELGLLLGYVVKIVVVVLDESYASVMGYDIPWTVYIERYCSEQIMDFYRILYW